jgi:hypothetical protein
VFGFPEANRAFVNTQCGAKRTLCQTSQDAGSAKLATGDKVSAANGHKKPPLICDALQLIFQTSIQKRIKGIPDRFGVGLAVGA